MGEGPGVIHTDLTWTLFLGGAVTGVEREVAPEAGLLVLYSAGGVHRVATVLSSERLAAYGWVRDATRRALLFDLHLAQAGAEDAALRVQLARANLLRMWAEG